MYILRNQNLYNRTRFLVLQIDLPLEQIKGNPLWAQLFFLYRFWFLYCIFIFFKLFSLNLLHSFLSQMQGRLSSFQALLIYCQQHEFIFLIHLSLSCQYYINYLFLISQICPIRSNQCFPIYQPLKNRFFFTYRPFL